MIVNICVCASSKEKPVSIVWDESSVGDIQYSTFVGDGCDFQVSSFRGVNGKVQANIDRFESLADADRKKRLAAAVLTKALLCRPASVHINVTNDDKIDKSASSFWQSLVHKLPTRDGMIIVDAPTLKQLVGRLA